MKKNKIFLFFVFLFFVLFFLDLFHAQSSAFGPRIETKDYIISRSKVDRIVGYKDVFRETIEISNLGSNNLDVSFSYDDSLLDIIDFENLEVTIGPENLTEAGFFVKGNDVGNYSGKIYIEGDINEELDVDIQIISGNPSIPFMLNVEFEKEKFVLKKDIQFNLMIHKLKQSAANSSEIFYFIYDMNNNSYLLASENISLPSSTQLAREFPLPLDLEEGEHIFEVQFKYQDKILLNRSPVFLKKSFFKILIFGFIPMWLILGLLALALLGGVGYYTYKKIIERRKKYKMKLDMKTIPKKTPGFFMLGKIAEKSNAAYLDPLRLTTHCIVAGATGGGKSISAQVIIEEALLNNVAVIVFDPTAQWSGMLRKCEDKKMLSYYPKFGLKESDAKGFKGNVRQVKNARELIDVSKHMNPGQIQIFSLNKLDPKDMDMFVANVIRQVFRSDPKESPNLKLLLVFDEVHRLLSKFGGSGEGFLQVERACREFRKWGMGVMLVSQVLSDFVGEIKANISTEVQMRTRDEGDLNRIKTKYGEDFLQSLVKASVGVGMFVNPAYNHAQPYFINFRPILHNTRRLSDEELDEYNKYNEIVDDIEYQIEQLEKEKVDVFDLKMELKLVKDKLMTGNFSVVDIYLEGLKPRVEKEWEKLGKKPKKRELKLVDEAEIKKSIEEAKKARAKVEAKEAKESKEKEGEKKSVKEDVKLRQLAPLTFDNGIMVSSIKELLDVLPTMDDEILKTHVNKTKNDIFDWLSGNLKDISVKALKGSLDKNSIIRGLTNLGKESKDPSKENQDVRKGSKKKGSKPSTNKSPEEPNKSKENSENIGDDKNSEKVPETKKNLKEKPKGGA